MQKQLPGAGNRLEDKGLQCFLRVLLNKSHCFTGKTFDFSAAHEQLRRIRYCLAIATISTLLVAIPDAKQLFLDNLKEVRSSFSSIYVVLHKFCNGHAVIFLQQCCMTFLSFHIANVSATSSFFFFLEIEVEMH